MIRSWLSADPYTRERLLAIPITVLLVLLTGGFFVPVSARWRKSRLAKVARKSSNPARRQKALADAARSDAIGGHSYLDVLMGADHRLSTSKTVVGLWTVVVAYILIALILVWPSDWDMALHNLDPTYLSLLAGPYAAAVLAKVAVSTRVSSGTLQKPTGDGVARLSDLFGDASQETDLFDVQYVIFNLIAVAFVLTAFYQATPGGFPSIPAQMVLLTGGPAAIYSLNKLAAGNAPKIHSVAPGALDVGETFTVYGENLMPGAPDGDPAGLQGPIVTVAGVRAPLIAVSANDTAVSARAPDVGSSAGSPVDVRVITAVGAEAFLAGAITVRPPASPVADQRSPAGEVQSAMALAMPPQPGRGGGPPVRPVPQPPMTDGALIQSATTGQLYVVAGRAKFPIPTQAEFQACGYDTTKIAVIPDAQMLAYQAVPNDRAFVQPRGSESRFFANGTAIAFVDPAGSHQMTAMAQQLLGLPSSPITLPALALAGFPTRDLLTCSPTPSSVVFPPQLTPQWAPPNAKWWPRPEAPMLSLPNGSSVVELRGWVTGVCSPGGECMQGHWGEPDWLMQIRLDPVWLDHLGIDWTTFFKLGDTLGMGEGLASLLLPPDAGASGGAMLSRPTLHVELNGFPTANDSTYDWRGAYSHPPPPDWTWAYPDEPSIMWPFQLDTDAFTGRPIQVGDYVVVSGSLVTDIPHLDPAGQLTSINVLGHPFFWSPDLVLVLGATWGMNETAQDCPARWTEMHPPDAVVVHQPLPGEPASSRAEADAVYGVSGVIETTINSLTPASLPIEFDLDPPADGADHSHDMIVVDEHVGPETNFSTIIAGNANLDGALITVGQTSAHISVRVQGGALHGVPGKFRAIYRLRWAPDPSKYRLKIVVEPPAGSVPLGQPTTITVTALDVVNSNPVQGDVLISGVSIGATGQPIGVTLTPNGHRLATVPGRGGVQLPIPILPTLTVLPRAPYLETSIPIGEVVVTPE